MKKTRRILITSCKGGVGKSTVAANIAYSLARMGHSIVLVDFDLGNRSLDLILGCENSAIYDICDVAENGISPSDAAVRPRSAENFYFIAAPFQYDGRMTSELLDAALSRIEETLSPEFIFIDTSGGADLSVTLSAACADEALIVSSQNPTAVRAAEKSGLMLDGLNVKKQYLIVNCFDLDGSARGYRASIIEIIDATKTQIIGVVPYEHSLSLAQERGILSNEVKKLNSAIAFSNIAKRITGDHIPLMYRFRHTDRSLLLK